MEHSGPVLKVQMQLEVLLLLHLLFLKSQPTWMCKGKADHKDY